MSYMIFLAFRDGERERGREPLCVRGMTSFGEGKRGREREKEFLA